MERPLDPFVGKRVRIKVKQGNWRGMPISGMELVFEGILHKEKYSGRVSKLDILMGHGRFDWWIEGRIVEGAEPMTGNFKIVPMFVESIEEIN